MNNSEKTSSIGTSTSQLVTYIPNSYWDRTSRPVYALAYLLSFIIFYEIATIIANPDVLNQSLSEQNNVVVAFVWIQSILKFLRFSEHMTWIAAPLVVILILLALQITSKTKWKVYIKDFIPMTIECIVLAIPLLVLSLLLNRSNYEAPAAMSEYTSRVVCLAAQTAEHTESAVKSLLINISTGIGAGIYEELIFRLVLICILMIIFQDLLRFERKNSIIISVVIAAVLFSVHHHIYFIEGRFMLGETFSWAKFFFRTFAGIYFAVWYAVRGFGIAAGTHVFYNIIAVTLNSCLGG